jgi:hypothetical protein
VHAFKQKQNAAWSRVLIDGLSGDRSSTSNFRVGGLSNHDEGGRQVGNNLAVSDAVARLIEFFVIITM